MAPARYMACVAMERHDATNVAAYTKKGQQYSSPYGKAINFAFVVMKRRVDTIVIVQEACSNWVRC